MTRKAYIEVTQEHGKRFVQRGIEGGVVMLNLLAFREVADYAASPELAPAEAISGEEAYRRYMAHTQPLLAKAGGEVVFMGRAGSFLIGPLEESWDRMLLVRYPGVQAFLGFAQDQEYLKGMAHRTAALADSRLLPLIEGW